jgi:outer membrane protein OmpA-like peptidoglycan-associated protein
MESKGGVLIMKNLIFSFVVILAVGCTALDENYIEAPLANQKADLRDPDRDGVINERDKCEGTPLEAQVDNYGCSVNVEVTEQMTLKVLFGNNSIEVSPLFKSQIANMATFLKEYPETSIELQGYASIPGNREHNLKLSQDRALMVQKEITNLGIDVSRVAIIGYGATNKGSDNSPAAQAQDRKVVATVVGYRGDIVKEWSIFSIRKK